MSRTVGPGDIAVIAAALVFILQYQCDGRAGGSAFKNAGKNRDGVAFAAGCRLGLYTGAPSVEIRLYVVFGKGKSGGASVKNAADGFAVGLTEGCQAKDFAECGSCHRLTSFGTLKLYSFFAFLQRGDN